MLCGQPVPASTPTAEEIDALFVENALRAQTLRVGWKTVYDETQRQRFSGVRADLMNEALEQGKIPGRLRGKISAQSQRLRRNVADGEARTRKTMLHDYWSDRAHFQTRSPWNLETGGPFSYRDAPDVEFPDVETTRQNLGQEFGEVFVLSHGPSTDNRFRIWEGRSLGKDARGSGLVRLSNPKDGCRFPPLALPKPEWGGTMHPIDEFFLDRKSVV